MRRIGGSACRRRTHASSGFPGWVVISAADCSDVRVKSLVPSMFAGGGGVRTTSDAGGLARKARVLGSGCAGRTTNSLAATVQLSGLAPFVLGTQFDSEPWPVGD